MAHRVTRRNKAVLSGGLHPHYRDVDRDAVAAWPATRSTALPPDAEGARGYHRARSTTTTSCVVVQIPTSSAICATCSRSPTPRTPSGALLIVVVTEVVSLGAHRAARRRWAPTSSSPKASRSATALNFGGPYVGLFATREKFVRQMPGRLVRRDRRCRRPARLRADAVDARAAYPPREGDQQHLHQLRPLRAGLHHPHDAARRGGPAAPRRAQPRQRRASSPTGWPRCRASRC